MRYSIVFVLSCLSYLTSPAQTLDKTEIEKRVDSIFARLNSPSTPGAAITIMQNGNVVTRKAYGMANLEHAIPLTHQSPIRLVYSVGREFICVGAALMEAEGLIRFEDKVRTYFPKLPEWSKDVTIQDLLNHSSGFVDEWSMFGFVNEDMRSTLETEQVLSLLYNQPLPEVEPGKGYMYNNTDIGLLRLIMEKASKQSLPDYLASKLFEPLGMHTTFMNDNVEKIIPGYAENYYGRGPFLKGRWFKFSPGGNYRMVTSASDLEKWLLATEDKNSLVAKAHDRLYRNARYIPVVSPQRLYVFGHEWLTVNGTEVIYSGGLGDFYIARIPSLKISIIFLANGVQNYGAAEELCKSFLPPNSERVKVKRDFPDQRSPVTKQELEQYTGPYLSKEIGYNSHIPTIKLYEVKLEGDSLAFYSENSREFGMTPYGNGYFKFIDANAMMKFTKPHPDSAMKWEGWQENDKSVRELIGLTRRVNNDRDYLQQFTGQYYSPHLDYHFSIVLNEKEELIVRRPTVRDVVLTPFNKDQFIMEGRTGAYSVYSWINFTRNKKGRVDGFVHQDSRTMHHRCDKIK